MSIAVKTDTGWQVLGVGSGTPGELPGLGGWATITSVWNGSGTKPNRYAYNDGTTDWVAFEWTADGSATVVPGLVDFLCVNGGAATADAVSGLPGGLPGLLTEGIGFLNETNPAVKVGVRGTTNGSVPGCFGGISSFGSLGNKTETVYGFSLKGLGGQSAYDPTGWKSSITGAEHQYSTGAGGLDRPGRGTWEDGTGRPEFNDAHRNGVVIVRVPASQAAGVPASEYVDVP